MATKAKRKTAYGRTPGQLHIRKRPETIAPEKKGKRSGKRAIPPLLHTYDAPKPEGAYFDATAANRAARWIEKHCRHSKGRWAGEPLLLMAWQRRLIRHIFGWKKEDGTRLISEVYLEVPRKAGKSTLASAVGLYLAYGDGEPGPEVVFAAYDKDQAKVCYLEAKRMVEASPELFDQSLIYASTSTIELADNPGGVVKALSNESAKQFGLNIHGCVFDELMTQTTRTLWDAVTTSGGAREQPLLFAISTAGWDRTTVCFEQRKRTEDVMNGAAEDPEFLGVVYGAPIEEPGPDGREVPVDWTDERVWLAANPSLGVTVKLDFYRAKCRKAINTPAEQNTFRTLYLSQWVGQEKRVIDMTAYERCEREEPAEPDRTTPTFGALDLSATTDLTAFGVLFERDGALDFRLRAWLPEANLLERERRDRVPYRAWAEAGYLELIPGPTIDQRYVKAAVLEEAGRSDLRDVGYDPWNASQMIVELEEELGEEKMVKMRQGFATLSPPMKGAITRIIEGGFRFGENPLMRWACSNVAAKTDQNGNITPDKARSGGRIDPFLVLIMALDGFMRRGRVEKKVSVYERRALEAASA
jgi:phage terminase large subunit-like protein